MARQILEQLFFFLVISGLLLVGLELVAIGYVGFSMWRHHNPIELAGAGFLVDWYLHAFTLFPWYFLAGSTLYITALLVRPRLQRV